MDKQLFSLKMRAENKSFYLPDPNTSGQNLIWIKDRLNFVLLSTEFYMSSSIHESIHASSES